MEFIDLKAQQASIRSDIDARIGKILDHGQYIMGPEVYELEERLASFVGVKHCIGVSSGTDALLIAMMALGIGAGDEVITTPFTFIATGEMIVLIGAKPVFVDIDVRTYNMDPQLIEAAITPNTKAIMPVSLYGQCADLDEINAIAEKNGLYVIEDAAQSLGATYKGRQSCGLSDIGCTSFFPSKPLGAYGDGGACFTDNDDLAQAMREIRVHGQSRRYHHPRIGINGRLDTVQAAVLLSKLDIFDEEIRLRSEVGDRYANLLARDCHGVVAPFVEQENTSVYAQYTIQVENRDDVQSAMKKYDVPTTVHYPVPLNIQPALLDTRGSLENAMDLSGKVLSLPMHPYLSQSDQQKVVSVLARSI